MQLQQPPNRVELGFGQIVCQTVNEVFQPLCNIGLSSGLFIAKAMIKLIFKFFGPWASKSWNDRDFNISKYINMELSRLSFNCQHRNYTSLDQIDWPVNGHDYDEFDCSYNELTSLAGLSNYMPNLKTIFFDFNKISSFEGLPQSLKYITCSRNLISNFDDLPCNTVKLWIHNNKLTSLEGLDSKAPNLRLLHCNGNQITSLHGLPMPIFNLDCDKNRITSFEGLTNEHLKLKTVSCNYNKIKNFKYLPKTVITLYCSNNQIASMEYLPPRVTYLIFGNNPVAQGPMREGQATMYRSYDHNVGTWTWTIDQIHNDVININVRKWIDGITLIRRLRLNFALHNLWTQYWHHRLDEHGFSRFIKYKAPKDYNNSGF